MTEAINFDFIKAGAIGYGDHVRIDGMYPGGIRISWERNRQPYTATIDIQLLAAFVDAWAQEHGALTPYLSTARVITKESHPEVWATLQPPKNMPDAPR